MNGRRPPGAAGRGWRRDDAPPAPPVALVEDQERPVAWMDRGGGRYPDPRHVYGDDVWDPVVAAWVPRPSAGCALITGLVLGGINGVLLGLLLAWVIAGAAPRPAANVIPAGAPWSGTQGPSTSGNLSQPTGAPRSQAEERRPGASASSVGADAPPPLFRGAAT